MKLTTSALLAAATVQCASALVIPDIRNKDIVRGTVSSPLNNKNGEVAITHKKDGEEQLAPLYVHQEPSSVVAQGLGSFIKNKYIIIFKDDINMDAIDLHKELIQQTYLQHMSNIPPEEASMFLKTIPNDLKGGIIDSFNIIGGKLNGYVGYFPSQIIDLIRRNPLVKSIEMDSIVTINDFDTQNNAPWGLARISHRDALTLGSFNKYLYDDNAGEDVDAYVIDTGINVEHNDFNGRAIWGKTIPDNDLDIDGNGHGTHCAGTIASEHYGVAKKANVIAVKVLRSNGSGSMSDVIKGVEFAALSHNHKLSKKGTKHYKGATANMSLGGGKSPSLDMVVDAAVRAGIHFAVAAGNENQDACNTSPASSEKAITVGASTLSDDRAYFSNWGTCVDIFAPGLNILSTYIGSKDATAALSGTSMASPHVAGLLTYFLSLQPEKDSQFNVASHGLTPEQLKKKLIDYSTKNVLFDMPEGTPNKLIFNGAGQDLSDLWNSSSVRVKETKPLFVNDYADMGFPSSDSMFEQIRNLFDNMNLF